MAITFSGGATISGGITLAPPPPFGFNTPVSMGGTGTMNSITKNSSGLFVAVGGVTLVPPLAVLGSPTEAMADMVAGKYIKIYGKRHPEIFQQ